METAAWLLELRKAYDDTLHPHAKAGSPQGGQFTASDSGTDHPGEHSGGGKSKAPAAKPKPKSDAKTNQPAKKTTSAKAAPAKKAADGHKAAKTTKPKARTRTIAMRQGNRGSNVRKLQDLLNSLKITDASGHKLDADGEFGPKTTEAIKALQERLGLKPTGRAGAGLLRRLKDAATLSPCGTTRSVESFAETRHRHLAMAGVPGMHAASPMMHDTPDTPDAYGDACEELWDLSERLDDIADDDPDAQELADAVREVADLAEELQANRGEGS